MKIYIGPGGGGDITHFLSLEDSGSEQNNSVDVLYEDQYEVLDFCNFNWKLSCLKPSDAQLTRNTPSALT